MVIKSLVWIALQVAAEVTVRALCALAALPALITVKQIATSQMVLPRCPPYDHIIFITNGLHQLSSTTTSSPVKYDFLRASAPNDLRPWIEHDLPQEASRSPDADYEFGTIATGRARYSCQIAFDQCDARNLNGDVCPGPHRNPNADRASAQHDPAERAGGRARHARCAGLIEAFDVSSGVENLRIALCNRSMLLHKLRLEVTRGSGLMLKSAEGIDAAYESRAVLTA